jgi:hypothetical protein
MTRVDVPKYTQSPEGIKAKVRDIIGHEGCGPEARTGEANQCRARRVGQLLWALLACRFLQSPLSGPPKGPVTGITTRQAPGLLSGDLGAMALGLRNKNDFLAPFPQQRSH